MVTRTDASAGPRRRWEDHWVDRTSQGLRGWATLVGGVRQAPRAAVKRIHPR